MLHRQILQNAFALGSVCVCARACNRLPECWTYVTFSMLAKSNLLQWICLEFYLHRIVAMAIRLNQSWEKESWNNWKQFPCEWLIGKIFFVAIRWIFTHNAVTMVNDENEIIECYWDNEHILRFFMKLLKANGAKVHCVLVWTRLNSMSSVELINDGYNISAPQNHPKSTSSSQMANISMHDIKIAHCSKTIVKFPRWQPNVTLQCRARWWKPISFTPFWWYVGEKKTKTTQFAAFLFMPSIAKEESSAS